MKIPVDLKLLMHRLEARYIRRALTAHRGCKSKAARELGLNRTTLVMRVARLQKLGFLPAQPK